MGEIKKATYITKKQIRAKAFEKVGEAIRVLDDLETMHARGKFDKNKHREELRIARCLLVEAGAQLELTLGRYV